MITEHGAACANRCMEILGGRRDGAGVVWSELNHGEQYALLLHATRSRITAREKVDLPWEQMPKELKVKIRVALAREIERAERFAAALDRVQ